MSKRIENTTGTYPIPNDSLGGREDTNTSQSTAAVAARAINPQRHVDKVGERSVMGVDPRSSSSQQVNVVAPRVINPPRHVDKVGERSEPRPDRVGDRK